ncbi:hypoxanthine phosphoribosyltransferase [Sorangium sp. So ce375]|uniref:hypoxanthine phosphoribosyltransferase n=1 Tax=Sorangium sp. So ce375 TaxID=3133306 RepID=UPI003F5C19B5
MSKREELARVLFTEKQIRRRVQQMGADVTRDYAACDLMVVGVLKGAATFTVDLTRAINLPVTIDWVAASTYGRGTTPGTPRLLKDLEEDVSNRDVLVVEDILDSGVTLSWLMNRIRDRSPASVHCCVLLRKTCPLAVSVQPRYVGFDITAHWVAGYGIDYAERYRNLGDLYEVSFPVTTGRDATGREA